MERESTLKGFEFESIFFIIFFLYFFFLKMNKRKFLANKMNFTSFTTDFQAALKS